MNPSIYVETSVVSYLTARLSRDLVIAARQEMTREWWELNRERGRLYVSELVIEEAQTGDADAAQQRRAAVSSPPGPATPDPALAIAEPLMEAGAVPPQAPRDALHIAVGAVYEMDYLVSWDFRHIVNVTRRAAIASVLTAAGRRPPIIATPEDLLEAMEP